MHAAMNRFKGQGYEVFSLVGIIRSIAPLLAPVLVL